MNERELSFLRLIGGEIRQAMDHLRREFESTQATLRKSVELQTQQYNQAIDELKRLIPEKQDLIDAVAKGITPAPTHQEMAEQIHKEVAALPTPADGKSVTADDVRPMLEEMVKTAVTSLPPPKDGKDYDPDVLQQAVEKAVSKAVAGIPVPADGKSVTVEDVAPILRQLVDDRFASLPPARDGKDYDPDVLQLAVKKTVDEAVATIPVPADGKSVTVEDVTPMLQQLVDDRFASLPPARDGKDYDPDVLHQAVDKAVDDAISGIPVLADGKSVTVDDVRPLLQELVAAAVPDVESLVKTAAAALPAPEPGRPGLDGRDALQLEILPAIDPEKSCPRGSYAIHDGGLWRAYEKTHGMRGWECLVEGIKDIYVGLSEDQREISVTVQRSSGQGITKTFAVPVTLYRGVFKSGTEYQPGDTVTWAGSVWHCDSVTTDKPGEPGSQGWTLAVKRGRDGRDKT